MGPATRRASPIANEAARLHHHLEDLPADQRIVVVLFDLEELPAPRIAEILGCPGAHRALAAQARTSGAREEADPRTRCSRTT